ncbi:MAG TPA: hypothetical protein GXZ47_00815 [Treponema sp.]|nr:hypothetical protein [Treponema sp.]
MAQSDLGKKVFFLYPPSVIRDELIGRLLDQEYEVYMLKDIKMIDPLIRRHTDSLVFVNIDAGLTEPEWEEWIRKTKDDPKTAQIGIGIVSYNTDEELQKKYLMDIGIQCGFIKLKLGLDESTRILLATLKANEGKGRRKYVRANCVNDTVSGINLREGPIQTSGRLLDMSIVGFSCMLDPDPSFVKNSILHDVQLRLRASLMRTKVVVFGSRTHEGRTVYVMLFAEQHTQASRDKIRNFIQLTLQADIEIEITTARLVDQEEIT